MTDEQLQRLAALAEAATPARWIAEQGMGVRLADYTPICMSSVTGEPVNVDANMAFIAAARQAVPELLAEAAALRRQLEHANRWRDTAIVEASNAHTEAAELRRQLAEIRDALGVPGDMPIDTVAEAARDMANMLVMFLADDATPPNRPGKGDTSAYLELRERLAVIQHDIWSHWMTYQFSVCRRNDDGTMTIPAEKVLRWKRQAETLYGYLPDPERESDRHQADKILAALNTPPHRPGKGDTR